MADGDVSIIAQQLRDRIEALVEHLLPAGIMVRRQYWRVGSLLGERGQSLCVYLAGARRGRWRDFSSGEHGDALDLVTHIMCNGEVGEAIKWARGWLGIGEIDPAERKKLAERAEKRRAERQRQAEREAAHNRDDALAIFLAGKPIARADATDGYLQHRGIDLHRLGRAPRALRTHPLLRHPSGGAWPAMVAAVCDPQGHHVATHRTWLAVRNLACEDGPVVVKAPVDPAKMTLGRYAGGCIRLGRGKSGKPWSQMIRGEPLLVGEGIEDVLSAMLDFPEVRAICAVSLSAMLALDLPESVGDVLLLQQGDRPGSPAARLLWRVIEHFEGGGHRVRLWGTRLAKVKDYNEFIRWRQDQQNRQTRLIGGLQR
jgi:Toprim domain